MKTKIKKNERQKEKRGKTGKGGDGKNRNTTHKKQQTNLRLIVHSLVVCLPTTIHLFSFNSLD